MFTAAGPTPPPGLTFERHVCVRRRGEVVSKPSMGSSTVQPGAVPSLAGVPTRWGWPSPLLGCWAAGIFSSPTALLPSVPHASAMAAGLK